MTQEIPNALAILRRKQVEAKTGLARSTIYARVAAGTFPTPINLGGGRAIGWIETEVDAWLKARIDESRNTNAPHR